MEKIGDFKHLKTVQAYSIVGSSFFSPSNPFSNLYYAAHHKISM